NDGLTLISPSDPNYGIRVRRQISLESDQPQMTITTEYEKINGGSVRAGVWVITQLRDPQRAFMVHEGGSRFAGGYIQVKPDPPMGLDIRGELISLTRARFHEAQIASDASTLLWMDQDSVLRIHFARQSEGDYPNRGSSAVIFTAMDPFPYVELETFGHMQTLEIGDRIQCTN